MGSKKGPITGYTYSMSIHMGLCRGPIDAIVNIKVDTKQLTYPGPRLTDGANIYIQDPYLFGGPQSEGGIVGGFETYFGYPTQVLSEQLKSLMGSPLPEFRGLTTVWFNGEVSCNNPYIKTWIFRAQRATQGWYQGICWYPEKVCIPISAAIITYYHHPEPGKTITFNGHVITYIERGQVPVGAQIPWQDSTALDAQALADYLNANQDIYGLYATTTSSSTADDNSVTVTLVNTSPDAPRYTITTTALTAGAGGDPGFNPRVVNGVLQGSNTIMAMNPAHILYEVCTNPQWGRGLPAAMMDDDSFRKAADQLYNEGFGLNFKWSQRDTLSKFCSTVIEHISAAMFISRLTGLMTLKLLRADYDPASLPYFDASSGLISVDNDGTSAQPTSPNEIIVTYHDPLQNVDLEMRAQNLASWKANQSTISQTNDYPGIGTPALAARVALRDLMQTASGLKKFTVKLDRSGRKVQPGDCFRISDPTRNISNIVLRAGQINGGTPTDRTISITAVQDVFSLPATGFNSPPVNGWVAPNNVPAIATQRAFVETNYRDLSYYLTAANLAAFPATSGAVTTLAANPGIVSATYEIATSTGVGVPPVNSTLCPWAPAGVLGVAIGLTDTALSLTNLVGTSEMPETPFAMLVDDEWMRVDSYSLTTGLFTVARGCVDTIPQPHFVNANCFMADFVEGSDYLEYGDGEEVNAQVLAVTGQGILSNSVAPIDTLVIGARWFRPYPPGNVQCNGQPYTDAPFNPDGADLVVTWASRNRVLQADALVDQSMSSVTPEAGTTYNITITNNGTVVRNVTGITALTWTYTAAMQATDSIAGLSILTLESERDGVVSWSKYSILLKVPPLGYGYGYGQLYGTTS